VALELCSASQLLERVRALGERLAAGLAELPYVRAVRGRGLMIGCDLDRRSAPELVRTALLQQRLVVGATGPETIRLEPPLVVTEEEVTDALGRLSSLA
jgi:acetylornithine aminotransferase